MIYILIEVDHGFSMGERSKEVIKGYTRDKELAEKFASQETGYCSYKYHEAQEVTEK